MDGHLVNNVAHDNCTTRIFNGHTRKILSFEVKDSLAASLSSDRQVKLWNVQTGECLWTYSPMPLIHWRPWIKIAGDYVVCAGREETPFEYQYENTIKIIRIADGSEEATIRDSRLITDLICVIGKRIFGVLSQRNIREWDFRGHLVREIGFEKNIGNFSKLFGSANFLVFVSNDIFIYYLDSNRFKIIELFYDSLIRGISSAHIQNNKLICGVANYSGWRLPNCYVVDLESGQITDQYHTCLPRLGSVRQVLLRESWAYLGHSSGRVVAVDLISNKHYVLGVHKVGVDHLALEGEILITGSRWVNNQSAELKFWDTRSLELIREHELPCLNKVDFTSGKVLFAVKHSLVQWDFLVSHQGERLAKDSPPKIDPAAPVPGPCVIQ